MKQKQERSPCKVPGCGLLGGPQTGLCASHHRRACQGKKINVNGEWILWPNPKEDKPKITNVGCKIDGCNNALYIGLVCREHFNQRQMSYNANKSDTSNPPSKRLVHPPLPKLPKEDIIIPNFNWDEKVKVALIPLTENQIREMVASATDKIRKIPAFVSGIDAEEKFDPWRPHRPK